MVTGFHEGDWNLSTTVAAVVGGGQPTFSILQTACNTSSLCRRFRYAELAVNSGLRRRAAANLSLRGMHGTRRAVFSRFRVRRDRLAGLSVVELLR